MSAAFRAGVVAFALALIVLAATLPSRAAAAFGPIELISKSSREQAQFATEPALSADGRYVAFCGELGGHEGIFREQRDNGSIVPVAVGPFSFERCYESGRYANAPSISADGRYIAFTTAAPLVEADEEPETNDVYIADMATSPPTYTLVSAVDGSAEPMPGAAFSAGRVAMSADANRVAFVDEGNVYVREISTRRTILISAKREPLTGMTDEPIVGGGAYVPEAYVPGSSSVAVVPAGAAISADGSTVAWVGEHLPEQVPMLSDEEAKVRAIEKSSEQFHEPLWRRVPGPLEENPPTRRVVGGGDPLAPGCPASGTIQTPVCQGPYPTVAFGDRLPFNLENLKAGRGWGVKMPQLDADGDVVAFAGNPGEQYDLFVVNMTSGLDRLEAVSEITRWTNPRAAVPGTENAVVQGSGETAYLPFTGAVSDCAISADGTRIAFTTTRQRFATSPLTLTTEVPAAVSLIPELYEADLTNGTIERLTPGPGKVVSEAKVQTGNAFSPSFDQDGRTIAFASDAENLVAGDANGETDVFAVEELPKAPVGTSAISAKPAQPTVLPMWRISANAYSRPDGSVRIVARVPGSGTLRALAEAQVGSRLKTVKVAHGKDRADTARTLMLDLRLGRRRRALIHQPGGLVTRLRITFSGPGGRPLHDQLQTRFLAHPKKPKHRRGQGR